MTHSSSWRAVDSTSKTVTVPGTRVASVIDDQLPYRKMAELKRRSVELRTQTEEYTYLSALRTALRKEKVRRESAVTVGPSPQVLQGACVERSKSLPAILKEVPATVNHLLNGLSRCMSMWFIIESQSRYDTANRQPRNTS